MDFASFPIAIGCMMRRLELAENPCALWFGHMLCERIAATVIGIAVLGLNPLLAQTDELVQVNFSREVRPLLVRQCFPCHGPDEKTREGDLRLDVAELATSLLTSGRRAIVPGQPQQSELMRRVTSADEQDRMPPPGHHDALSPDQVKVLRNWIAQGAGYTEHWSFQQVCEPELPSVRDRNWIRSAIDTFVLAGLEARGIQPAPEADRTTLIRRVTLDLTGIPPTPDEVRKFLSDSRPDAYERVVERLLSAPGFGERFGRHWLDMARYADSNGYLGDELRPYAWLYRDWVIDAINTDMAFDQFTVEQFAGDLLPDASDQQRIATGFLRNSLDNTEAGSDREENRVKALVDRVSTLGSVWLGLSVACAECHAHKYDPIPQEDFYGLFAFFNDADDVDMPISMPDEMRTFESNKSRWDERRKELVNQFRHHWANDSEAVRSSDIDSLILILSTVEKQRKPDQIRLLDDLRKQAAANTLAAMRAVEQHVATEPVRPNPKVRVVAQRKENRPTFVHQRGDYRRVGNSVVPATLSSLPPLATNSARATRVDLARWLVADNNPLTPRVVVNHLWRVLFGQGLVTTEDDFGVNGRPPSHPELLDWLASRMLHNGWSRKELVRMVVCSATYRQASTTRPELLARDPLNSWLARQNRFRLEAEAIRDAALQASSLLTRQIGGRSIRPPQPAYITSISRNLDWQESKGADRYRRGLYILLRRATPYPVQIQFDAPEATVACTQRQRTNSPLQALTLLNDPVFVECAKELGTRIHLMHSDDFDVKCDELYYRCLGRAPHPAERLRMRVVYDEIQIELRSSPHAADLFLGQDTCGSEATQTAVNRVSWMILSRVIMNLDEFITRE